MRKKIFSLLLVVSLTMTSFTSVFAATNNINVSTTPPGTMNNSEISTYTVNPPDSYIDLTGKMEFEGTAKSDDLYLNKAFTGVKGVDVNVKNNSSSTLKVTLYKYSWYQNFHKEAITSFTVVPNQYVIHPITGLSSSSAYYLGFSAPCDFKGFLESR
ncbi:hypothetical protein [Anaerosporobacter sp.]